MNANPKDSDKQSQQQQQSGTGQQYGEGNYKASRDYNSGLKDHVEHHDIEKEARDAAPRSAAEEKEMEEAERIGKSKSRGEGGDIEKP
jgi:CRISPR/Cas system-associated protein Cas5 (RAMP superfamily)